MKNGIITILLIFLFSNVFGQKNDRIYLAHGDNFGPTYSYDITEMIIHSDSTYTSKSYSVFNKKDWETYKTKTPEISNGKITRNGEFYILTQYRNGNKTDFFWTVKISDKKLVFYYANDNGKMKKTGTYKRILLK